MPVWQARIASQAEVGRGTRLAEVYGVSVDVALSSFLGGQRAGRRRDESGNERNKPASLAI